ncbi:50S ribosomal protein L2 [Candidatus Uhrbacteria bacterium]|nr:50S ribosomal protein L2 [Candidatus Uhrbacteria bacterium]
MSVKIYNKNTAGRRYSSVQDFSDITKTEPTKSLIVKKKMYGGRNAHGHITVRHRGGGEKRYIRLVDWKQERYDIPARVEAIEYDPNRSSRIALVTYPDKEQRYILCPVDLHVGDTVLSSQSRIDVKPANRMILAHIPVGITIYNIELQPGKGGAIVRSAGAGAQLVGVEGDRAQLKLPSGEIRLVSSQCSASIGMVSNPDWRHVRIGKAGRMRHMGWRPEVRGKVMNPVDHPHGGGEGKNPIGLKHAKTLWGKTAMGVKTRKPQKWSNRFILQRRKK